MSEPVAGQMAVVPEGLQLHEGEEVVRSMSSGKVVITTAGGEAGKLPVKNWYRVRDARAFVDDVNRLVRDAHRGNGAESSTTPSDASGALRTLTTLRDDGQITEEEYAAKRAEILSRL